MKKTLDWIGSHIRLVLIGLGSALLLIFCFLWFRKNEKIRELQRRLAVAQAKARLEALAAKYQADLQKLRELGEKETAIKDELIKIGDALQHKLDKDMTAEQIVEEFKRIGLIDYT